MSERIINPRTAALRVGMQEEGWQSQRDIQQANEDTRRFADAGLDRLIIQETFTAYLATAPASGTTTMLSQFSTGAATTSFATLGYRTPAQGRVLLIRLSANANVTAGTVTPRVSVTESGFGATYDYDDCQLSTADPLYNTSRFNWENGSQIARDASVSFRLITSGLSPTTLLFTLQAVIGYEDWVSS